MVVFLAKPTEKGFEFETPYNAIRYKEALKNHDGLVRIEFLEKGLKPRTPPQNNSLHLWYALVAQALNDAGYTVQLVLKEKMELYWTGEMVKELLWRPAQKAILKKKSTTELRKVGDIDPVFDHLNRHLGEKFQIYVPWPTMEEWEKQEIMR